jgi:hypothetical protein
MTTRQHYWKESEVVDRADTEVEVLVVGHYLFGWVQRDPDTFPKWEAVMDERLGHSVLFDTKDEAKAFLTTLANADPDLRM